MKMKNALVFSILALAGCSEMRSPVTDQCLRRELFTQCLKNIPKGPASVKYNDWDDVVSACERAAYYQSFKPKAFIKPECATK